MKVMEWPDGAKIDTDPVRDDPLYYYLGNQDWSQSIGFLVKPEYQEARATNVAIAIWHNHADRAANLTPAEATQMYERVIEALVNRFKHWQQIVIKDIDESVALQIASPIRSLGWNVRILSREAVLTRVE